MADKTNAALSGAGQGAAAGSVAGPWGAVIGGAVGGLSGLLSNQQEGSKNSGNVYNLDSTDQAGLKNVLNQSMDAQQVYGGDPTKDVMSNALTGQTFGAGGTLANTTALENQQAHQGFQLTPEDQTAYGQASGNIARQFGQSDQSLSQALSDRGLSDSGVAGAAFTGSQGNKNEQLAGLQTQIAQKRMEMNQTMLANTRQFLGNLVGQGQNAVQGDYNREMGRVNQYNQVLGNRADMANNRLTQFQNQANINLGQAQQTQHASTASQGLSGALQGGMAAYKLGSGMSGSGSGGAS